MISNIPNLYYSDMKFAVDPDVKKASEVTTYFLTPEQLEEVRAKHPAPKSAKKESYFKFNRNRDGRKI